MNRERFRFFRVVHYQTDLLVGVPYDCFRSEMERIVEDELVRLRKVLLDYSKTDPRFFSSLDPLEILSPPGAEEIRLMLRCGEKTGTGPMSSVAGMFAQQVGRKMLESFGEMEVVVENGGDLYIRNQSELISAIHAGVSDLSDKMAFVVPPGEWGICTSSGTMGHSYSKGRADAVTVISPSAPLADSWATAIANLVHTRDDIERILETFSQAEAITAIAIIVGNQVGIRGNLEVKLSDRQQHSDPAGTLQD